MVETVRQSLRHSKTARWSALFIVSFTMLTGYYVADVASPLKPLMEQQLRWDSEQYGFFTSSYGWFNVFLGMLVVGGIILDRWGARFAGILAAVAMLAGTTLKWWAFNTHALDGLELLGKNAQVLTASVGYATFGMGLELCGITASKIIVRWFRGYELALAMGLQVAVARVGTGLALGGAAPIASAFRVSTPVLVGALALALGLVAFLVYCAMDRRLDASEPPEERTGEAAFRLSDIGAILSSRGFWYIAVLCALFYSAVFPFLKYAPDLMVQKFGVSENLSGLVPSMLPFGTILLTPLFGRLYDERGRGATLMILGAGLILAVHLVFTLPFLTHWLVAIAAMLVLGIGFSLVPSAMWPSVPRLVPERQLGTAYALIFFLQNLVALMGAPYLIGWVLDTWCIKGQEFQHRVVDGVATDVTVVHYDYTGPMAIFAGFGLLALLFAWLLRREDRRKGYGLEAPCRGGS
ncbi:MAG: MFS transporter [Deltaproteobacteria bacterium]|nr:MFS transporter [Deltaproteobacteria bacterium]